MAKEQSTLKLGKRASFVKTHLKQLRQNNETWEADFRALPKRGNETETHYLGMVVALPKGDPLTYLPVEYTPNVNDLADLLAEAMRQPLTGSRRRPEHIRFRGNPRWEELFRHLNELGIATTIHNDLLRVEEVYHEFLRQMRKASPSPIIMLSPGPTHVEEHFPAIAKWVHGYGHVEIGDQEGFGFVVRALDYGGLVFEDNHADTLATAMAALEKGLARWFHEQGIDVS
jgi:hypothetical protein